MMRRILLVIAVTAVLNGSPIAWNAQQTQSKEPVPCGDLTTQSAMNGCFGNQALQDQAKLDALLKELSVVLEKSELTRLTAVQKVWTSSVIWSRIDGLKRNLCEGHGMTGECAASKKYARSER